MRSAFRSAVTSRNLIVIGVLCAVAGIAWLAVPASRGWLENNGEKRTLHPDGSVALSFRLKDGKLDGPRIEWSPDGVKVREVHHRMGVLHGPDLSWWDDGGRKREGAWADGLPTGEWQEWYEDGTGNSRARNLISRPDR